MIVRLEKILQELDNLILSTSSGDLRNDLTDVNIKLVQIKTYIEDGEYDKEHVQE